MKKLIYLLVTLVALCIHLRCSSQSFSNAQILKNFSDLDQNNDITNGEKFRFYMTGKKNQKNTVYRRILFLQNFFIELGPGICCK